ncbi:synaptotagmin 2-like [Mercenaria mercenaria]|uniref:synaptotagmin 2-like n=1 Tax=Mercenaria mercenaria TaxID=6596 RepID=UPI001E1D8A21|nr:synaptotagmin 2-like [Mercenaria mercenaria]
MFSKKFKSQSWSPNKALKDSPEEVQRLSNLLKVRSEHDQAVAKTGWDNYQRELQNNQMLKGLFKKLDPTVMKPTGDIRGEVQLSFKYDFNNDMLLIKVIKCREMANKDIRAKMSNFFVKLELLPDPLNQGERRTKVVHGTNSPRFDEIFGFCIPEHGLGESKLIVQVSEHSLGGNDDVKGEVIIPLNTFSFHSEPTHTAWYALNMETDLSISGSIDVSVAFQPPRTLLVTIHGANNLAPRDEGQTADPFVKVAVPGSDHMFQTQVLKNTLNPVWSETFEFPLHEEEFHDKYIIFHVIDNVNTGNDSLGQCIVELNNLNPEFGVSGSFELSDLRNNERVRAKVYQNRIAQEFREALTAHSEARAPGCLFKKHAGGKVVTVTCRKAGAQGRMRIVDGIPIY